MDNEYESPWGLQEPDSGNTESQPVQINDDELGINTEVQVKRTRYVAKLDDERMLGEKGLGALKHLCSKIHLKGNGHEVGDLGRLLDMYQMWSHDMFPKGQFKNLYSLTSKTGRSASVRNVRLAWIDEEQTGRKVAAEVAAEEAALIDLEDDLVDVRERGRHFEQEERFSRQSGSEPLDNPDDLFVGMDSVDHRLVSDEDVDIQAEVSRREEEEEGLQDVSELLEGARAQREEDISRSSARGSLFDIGGGDLTGDIFGSGSLDVPMSTQLTTEPTTTEPTATETADSQTPSTEAPTEEPPSTQEPSSTQAPSTQAPSTQATQEPPATQTSARAKNIIIDDDEFDELDQFDIENQEQHEPEPDPEDYDDDDEMAVLREMGM